MPENEPKIIYTLTDEAPALATYSLLPVIKTFCDAAGVAVETRDISLAGRILAHFPDHLDAAHRVPDALAELGELAGRPEANIIKLPNISASVPQLTAAIEELREQGCALPDYPVDPADAREAEIKARYDKVKGSAVNPVLREGNSDRRAAPAVKAYARNHPHSMGEWSADSASHVASMDGGDFFENERAVTMDGPAQLRIVLESEGGTTVLKDGIEVEAGEVVDATFMSASALRAFLAAEIDDAAERGVLFSLHMKATMMKVSDPVIFGHAVSVFYGPVLERHAAVLEPLGVDLNNGIGDLYAKIGSLDAEVRERVEADINGLYAERPGVAMVDSDRGITNLHVPSDVIIDASMPAAIRSSGRMWNADGALQDTKFVIPDRCYAGVYRETVEFCKEHGAFDPRTMGSVPNVGLMAKKAEEYGSHDKTFVIPADGTVRVVDAAGTVILEHGVERGDIWRMCTVKDAAIRNWVKLAVDRARATGAPAVFWLNEERAHDRQLIAKVREYLGGHDTDGLEISILSPVEATRLSLQRAREGRDTISVTGNVLRDYLTDLFPILELGTSAKMLSIVPLMNGGGLFETGAGGSAPKHVQQFVKEGHLRWDSLGEFLALGASLEHLASAYDNARAGELARALDVAIGRFLESNKSPSRKVHELDNRGSHFYLALYWAEAFAGLASGGARERFKRLAATLGDNEERIVGELNGAQGAPVDIGGYYRPDPARVERAMRPSATFNAALESVDAVS